MSRFKVAIETRDRPAVPKSCQKVTSGSAEIARNIDLTIVPRAAFEEFGFC